MPETTDRKGIHGKLIERAREDEAFKARLIQDPKAAIEDCLGAPVPDGIEIEVLEEKPNKLYLVLPVAREDMELSDEALEKVAGGEDCTACVWTCGCGP